MTASVAFGWRCIRCGATGESSHWLGSQSDLEVHWLARHGLPMPEAEALGEFTEKSTH